MRVTFNMISSSISNNVSASAERLLEAQNTSSTQKRINKPSDDVTGTGQALRLKSAIADIDQFSKNCDTVSGQLSQTSNVLSSVVSTLQSVRTLASQGANSSLSDAAKASIVAQLDAYSTTLLQDANTQYSGKYLLSGSTTSTTAVVIDPSGAAPYKYQGNDTQLQVQIGPSIKVASNVTADSVFNLGGTAVPGTSDVFSLIAKVKQEVTAGDTTGLSNSLSDIDANLANVNTINSQVGARLNMVNSTSTSITTSKTTLNNLLSKTTDADMVQAVIDLKNQENLYEAATSTASSVLQLSLANYLK